MRIVSLTPAATEIVYALGLGDQLVGRTHACDYPAEVVDVPVLTSADRQAPEPAVDRVLLQRLEPDLVLTDGSEDQPLVDYWEISELVGSMSRDTTLVALAPHTIEGILNSVSTVGAYAEAEYEAVGLVETLRERLGRIDAAPAAPPRRVAVLEQLEPLLSAGRWVPEMVRRAGGWDVLGREGEPSAVTDWERLRELEPEVIVLALRATDAAGAERTLAHARLPRWFDDLQAVRGGGFFAVDGHGLFARPGPRVIEGVAVLAELLEPELFADSGPVEAWRPLAPVGLADSRHADRPGG